MWLFAKHRPLITCPFCKGKGGEVSGYYEPEWTECYVCYHHWDKLEDHGIQWTMGRLPVLEYLRSRVSIWCGLWYAARFRDIIRYKLGIHRWVDEETASGGKLCCVCYAMKGDG